MKIDGKKIAENILALLKVRVSHLQRKVILSVFVVGDNLVTEKFIALKKKKAEEEKLANKDNKKEKLKMQVPHNCL